MTTDRIRIYAPTLNGDGEVALQLANGFSIRSGGEHFISGEYVRLVAPNGDEVLYWDQEEWRTDPALVMGAIINVAITAPDDHPGHQAAGTDYEHRVVFRHYDDTVNVYQDNLSGEAAARVLAIKPTDDGREWWIERRLRGLWERM